MVSDYWLEIRVIIGYLIDFELFKKGKGEL